MRSLRLLALAGLLLAAACGRQEPQQTTAPETAPVTTPAEENAQQPPLEALPPVDAGLVAAPNSAFTAIEPSEVGVFGAPTVMDALAPLIGPEGPEGSSVQLSVREAGDISVADIVRSGLTDDSVSAGHVRIEFRREADGWYPTNAYRRAQCARGPMAGQWTTELCP